MQNVIRVHFKATLVVVNADDWEDWELPCYVTSFLTIVILGVGLNAKPDMTLETWAHQKALEMLQAKELAAAATDE
ncbi:hypothetical protein Tco_0998984 [Tanacetum coccineum]